MAHVEHVDVASCY